MNDETQQPSVLSMRQEDLDELLTRAAERGAERALACLGLENGHAAAEIQTCGVSSMRGGKRAERPGKPRSRC